MMPTYAEAADRLSENIRKFKDESGPDGMVLAAGELFGQARELGAHTIRYARLAYRLDMLFLFFAVLIFSLVLLMGVFVDRVPPEIIQALDSNLGAVGLGAFLLLLLGPVILPTVFCFVFAAVCRQAEMKPAGNEEVQAPEKTGGAGTAPDSVQGKLHRVGELLDEAVNELDLKRDLPGGTGQVLCILFMIPVVAVTCCSARQMKVSSVIDYIGLALAYAMFFLVFVGVFQLLLWLKLRVLVLAFSNRKIRKEIKTLRDEFALNMFQYQKRFEEEERRRGEEEAERQRLADLKEGAELYQKALQGGTIDDNLMVLAAEKGDPQASLYVGEQIIMLVQDGGFTTREIKEFYEDARDYFEAAAGAGLPDGIFWHAAAQVITESHDERGWMEILRRVRALDKATLSQACINAYDMVVEHLVDLVNEAAARAEAYNRGR